jgi:hypothetical protein
VLIAYLNEHDDAKQTERFVKDAGRNAVRPALAAGDFLREEVRVLMDPNLLVRLGDFGLCDLAVFDSFRRVA